MYNQGKRSVDFYNRHASRLHPVDLFAYLERGIDIAFDSEDNTRAALIYGTLPWSETEPLDFSLLDNVVSRNAFLLAPRETRSGLQIARNKSRESITNRANAADRCFIGMFDIKAIVNTLINALDEFLQFFFISDN